MNGTDAFVNTHDSEGVKSANERCEPRTQDPRASQVTVWQGDDRRRRQEVQASLWDFSSHGIGISTPQELPVGEEVSLSGELRSPAYSVGFAGSAEVVHCRRIAQDSYRVGLRFVSVQYRRLPSA